MNVIYSYVWKGSHGCGKLGNLRNVKIVISRLKKVFEVNTILKAKECYSECNAQQCYLSIVYILL